LSTYQNLEPQSSTFMRYLADDATLKKYSMFIVDPVAVRFYDEEDAKDLKPEDIQHLQQFMYAELTKDLSEGGFKLTNKPGPGVARIRIALTNLKESTPALNVLPQSKLTGLGLGQAAAEFEMVDSLTGKQIAAAIESQQGSRAPWALSGLSSWGNAESIMKDWAERITKRLQEAHGMAK